MPDQAQCPNCGGFKKDVTLSFHIEDDDTEHALDWTPGNLGAVIAGVFLGVIVGGVIIWAVIVYNHSRWRDRGVNGFKYRCALCGYEWAWRVDEPYPHVTVRPDLIRSGEERLRKEQEQGPPPGEF